MAIVQFKAVIKKFGDKGEKTSWHYIEIPVDIADQLKKGYKKIIQGERQPR